MRNDKGTMKANTETSKRMTHLRPASVTALAMVCAIAASEGCDSRVKSPADQADFMVRTRCGPEVNDAALAPILDGQAVRGVEPLYATIEASKSGEQSHLRGAVLTVSALPGVTPEWLDRELECHSANMVLGQAKAVPDDPFWLPGSTVDIDVRPAKDGFLISVAGWSSTDARQILERSQSFAKAKAAPASP
jgi:hypothetical protein